LSVQQQEAEFPIAQHAMIRGLLRRPVLLAVLTVALVGVPPTVTEKSTGAQLATVTPADLGAVLLVAATAFRLIAGSDFGVLRSKVMLAPTGVLAAALLTTMWSTDPMFSLVGVVRYAELFCLVPLCVVLCLRDRLDVVLLLGAVVALGAVEGAIGTYQSLTKTGAGINGETIRAIGTFGITNQIAMSTVVSCAFLALLVVALCGRPIVRFWAGLGAAALIVPLILSLSRGGVLAALVAGLVVVLATGPARAARTLLLVAPIALVAVMLTGGTNSTIAARFDTITSTPTHPDRSVQDRYDLWTTAVSIWHAAPVTGVGIKQFPAYRDTHAPIDLSSGSDQAGVGSFTRVELLSPHNEYLLLLSEQGIIGLGSYVLLLLILTIRNSSLLRSPADGSTHRLVHLVSIAILTRFAIDNVYGDLAGSTAVLYALLTGLQLRSAVTDRFPILDDSSRTWSGTISRATDDEKDGRGEDAQAETGNP
jgi:O-antigen ligase